MYAQYWGLIESPFKGHVDSRWLYESPGHEEALARLFFTVEQNRQCGALVGRSGTGKTLLLDILHREVRRTQREAVFLNLFGCTGKDLLWEIAAAFGLAPATTESSRGLWRIVHDYLQTNQFSQVPTVLILDHLDHAELDCINTLTRLFHLQAGTSLGTTIVLSVGTENLSLLNHWLSDVTDLRTELPPLDATQTSQYVETLLRQAGATQPIFANSALALLHDFTGGIPRDINRLCDLAMVAAMADGQSHIDEGVILATADQLCWIDDADEPDEEAESHGPINRLAPRGRSRARSGRSASFSSAGDEWPL